ncbi:MAG TPA: class II fructose-bisphosphatase [Chloroflexota bacterium]
MTAPLDRNLALELVRATEAAALAAARWMGRGDTRATDRAAADAMRLVLATLDMDGTVIIGPRDKQDLDVLSVGERIGNGSPPSVDVAVDPIDGTGLAAHGLPGALSIVALAERDTLFQSRVPYMDKIVVGPRAAGVVSIEAPVRENLESVALASDREVGDLTVVILSRQRNQPLVEQVRGCGARIRLIGDGDVAGALMAMMEEHAGADVLMGVGGAPEGVLAACAARCLGGDIQARLWLRPDTDDAEVASTEGRIAAQVLTLDDLCRSDSVFVATTGVTTGELLEGVRYFSTGAVTQSLVMRSASGTVRWIDAKHDFNRLRKLAGSRYEAGQSTASVG